VEKIDMDSMCCIELVREVGVPLRKFSGGELYKIVNAPQAQKRTAKFKKSVYIVEDRVFKGPYACDDRGLINSLRYTYALELLEAALQLPEWQRGSLQWEYLGCGADDHYYLAAPNVGKRDDISFERVTTKIEENVKVVPRGTAVLRVSDIEGTDQLTNEIKIATLQHLYLRFLLDIGDSGTHNVLIRKDRHSSGRLIAGIDLDERRGIKEKERRLDYLFKKAASKKQASLYHSDVCKIKSLAYSQFDHHTLDRLSAVGIDLKRLKWNTELWERLP
jgi:hypothetical protein